MAIGFACVCLTWWAAAASAASPTWRIDALANTSATPGDTLEYLVQTSNVGDAPMNGETIILFATLPAGVSGVEATLLPDPSEHNEFNPPEPITCTAGDGSSPVLGAHDVLCLNDFPLGVPGGQSVRYQLLHLKVKLDPGVPIGSSLTSSFTVAGGGAPATHTAASTLVAAQPQGFGIAGFDAQLTGAAGEPASQAGGHPADSTVSLDYNTTSNPITGAIAYPVAAAKDTLVQLPPGFVGDPAALAAHCTTAQIAQFPQLDNRTGCPVDSQVGTVMVHSNNLPFNASPAFGPVPLFSMVAPPNAPARFGFDFLGTIVTLDAKVHAAGGYTITVGSANTSEAIPVAGFRITFWGVPSDPSHTPERTCTERDPAMLGGPGCESSAPRRAFLRNPTSCTGPGEPLTFTAITDSWAQPGRFTEPSYAHAHLAPGYPEPQSQWGEPIGITGCDQVPFAPSIAAQPTTAAPDTPSGLSVTLTMPQSDDPTQTAQSDLRKLVMHFPQGMTVNPAAANGLGACSEAQIGLGSDAPQACPDASKLGTVQIETPLLDKPLTGALYLAAQDENPFHSLLATYLVAEGPGVVIKLPGKLEADPHSGQLTAVFDNTPQLPFSAFHLELFAGAGAPLVTPSACGSAPFSSEFTGWNGASAAQPTSYTVTCTPGLGAFNPAFLAGSSSPQAGAFSPFQLSLSRHDGEQKLGGLTFTMPPGADALLAAVGRCPDAAAATGDCPQASRIGTVTVAAGAGNEPVYLKGSVYLTGPYNGGPFGEVVVVPAVAGPFDLGNVVVRGSIRADQVTAQPTIVSDPFPQFVGSTGIPTDVRRVDVTLDRPGFTFNPTGCEGEAVTGTLTGDQGATANVSSHFQAANCALLSFHPSFTATTRGNGTFNHNGASLDVKLATRQGPGSGEANIRKVEVQLPRKLPARLTTLQKACTEAQFATNPAGCPAASDVGMAVAHTPVLQSPLSGPAYLVSHGGQAFPDLVLILQGEGVVLHVTGHTQIRNGITYSRFETVPDAPISSFELNLPESPTSALAATESLCSSTRTVTVRKRVVVRRHGRTRHVTRSVRRLVTEPLAMPTTITAQNGAVLSQTTRIGVTGCAKAKPTKAKHRQAKGARRHGRGGGKGTRG